MEKRKHLYVGVHAACGCIYEGHHASQQQLNSKFYMQHSTSHIIPACSTVAGVIIGVGDNTHQMEHNNIVISGPSFECTKSPRVL